MICLPHDPHSFGNDLEWTSATPIGFILESIEYIVVHSVLKIVRDVCQVWIFCLLFSTHLKTYLEGAVLRPKISH